MFVAIDDVEYTIRFRHYHGSEAASFGWHLSNTPQHVTLCDIEGETSPEGLGSTPNYFIAGTGLAICSASDQFNKEKGRKIALARALLDAKFDRPTRSKFWAAYRFRSPARDTRTFNADGLLTQTAPPNTQIFNDVLRVAAEQRLIQPGWEQPKISSGIPIEVYLRAIGRL